MIFSCQLKILFHWTCKASSCWRSSLSLSKKWANKQYYCMYFRNMCNLLLDDNTVDVCRIWFMQQCINWQHWGKKKVIQDTFTAHVLKVCRTPGPTACYKATSNLWHATVNIPLIAMFFASSGSWNGDLKLFLTPECYPLAAGQLLCRFIGHLEFSLLTVGKWTHKSGTDNQKTWLYVIYRTWF